MKLDLVQITLLAGFLALAGTVGWAVWVMSEAGRSRAWWGMAIGAAAAGLAVTAPLLTGVLRWQLPPLHYAVLAYIAMAGVFCFCMSFRAYAKLVDALERRAADLERACREKSARVEAARAASAAKTETA